MKFEQIVNNNKILLNLRGLNKLFDYELGKILLTNLAITNKLVNAQNIKLNNLVAEYADVDGYDYVIKEGEKKDAYMEAYKAIFDEDIDIESMGYKHLTERNLRDSKFDIETLELLSALISQN